MKGHVIPPTFFYEAINIFEVEPYNLYRIVDRGQDDEYRQIYDYEHFIIQGSLQSQGKRLVKSKSGNRTEIRYEFYCKNLYQIDEGDIIHYKGDLLRVETVYPYDPYGVRHVSLLVVEPTGYQDLLKFIKTIEGVDLI